MGRVVMAGGSTENVAEREREGTISRNFQMALISDVGRTVGGGGLLCVIKRFDFCRFREVNPIAILIFRAVF